VPKVSTGAVLEEQEYKIEDSNEEKENRL